MVRGKGKRLKLAVSEAMVADYGSQIRQLEIQLHNRDEELATLMEKGVPGVMHEVDKAFHDLAIRERDAARMQVLLRDGTIADLEKGLARQKSSYEAEIAQLKAELDQVKQVNVVHFLEKAAGDVTVVLSQLYADEPIGTVARATDTGHEWVKLDTGWSPLVSEPQLELRLGGKAPGLYADGKLVEGSHA